MSKSDIEFLKHIKKECDYLLIFPKIFQKMNFMTMKHFKELLLEV